jgi:putative SOS response-associated peptidase YedK
MCANYVPTRPERLLASFGVRPPRDDYPADAYPGQTTPMVVADAQGRHAVMAVFGMVPPWSRDGRNWRQCYNARSETVGEKPSFRHAWRQRQWCVVPADAVFEPSYDTGRAVRWRIESADGQPLALAGLWERWRSPQGESLFSFTMLTLNADQHAVMSRFHAPGDEKRSVVLLAPDAIDAWLGASPEQARSLLRGFDPARVRCAPQPRPPRARPRAMPDPGAQGLGF